MSSLTVGSKNKKTFTVKKEDTAFEIGSGGLNVLGTPVIVRWVEQLAYQFIQENLVEDLTSVGSKFSIKHISPTPVYEQVTVELTLDKIDRNIYQFSFIAQDEAATIAVGSHTRVIVDVEKFLNKLEQKYES